MPTEEQSSTSAKILYRPVGLLGSVVAGVVAGQVFKQTWKHAAPGDQHDGAGSDLRRGEGADESRRCPGVPAVDGGVARRLTASQYRVVSEKSGGDAVHKPEALKKKGS